MASENGRLFFLHCARVSSVISIAQAIWVRDFPSLPISMTSEQNSSFHFVGLPVFFFAVFFFAVFFFMVSLFL